MEKDPRVKIKTLYSGIFITVTRHRVEAEGSVVDHEVIEEKPGVLIIPVTKEGKIVLLKTERYRFGKIYEVVAGAIKIDKNETPLTAGKRELREEAGLKAKKFTLLSKHVDSVHSIGNNYIFLAEGLTHVTNKPDSDEKIETIEVDPEDALRLAKENKIPSLRNKAAIWAAYIHITSKK